MRVLLLAVALLVLGLYWAFEYPVLLATAGGFQIGCWSVDLARWALE